MNTLDFKETKYLLEQLERLIKGIDVIATETNQSKKDKCVKLFKEIVNNCQTKIDKENKVLPALVLEWGK